MCNSLWPGALFVSFFPKMLHMQVNVMALCNLTNWICTVVIGSLDWNYLVISNIDSSILDNF